MFASEIKCIIILLVTLLSVSSRSDIELSYEGENAKKYYNYILKSLVGLNEKRVGHLKRLYTLNNYNFGKESLRNVIKNAKGYNDLKKSINVVLKGINNNAKDNSNSAFNSHRTYNLNLKKYNRDSNHNLKQEDTSYKDISETRKDDDEQDNISENIISINDGNIMNALRYYFFVCGGSRRRCRRACRGSYKYLCSRNNCTDTFEKNMKQSCKKACKKRF